jgi:HK97 family phage prohead protease
MPIASRKIVDIVEFRERVGRGHKPGTAVRLLGPGADLEAGTATERTVTFIFSDDSVDRYGDRIDARGWLLDNFKANPVVLFGHDASCVENVIGRATSVRIEGNSLIGEIEFMAASVNPNAESAYQMVKGGYLHAVSVGFQPLDWAMTKDKGRPGGIDFKKQELLEVSIVPIPANANALIQAKAAGIDIERLGFSAPELPVVTQKGLYEVSWLASLLESLGYLHDCVEWEAEYEGDASAVPAKLAAALKALGQVLIEMTAEEVAELLGGEEDDAAILTDDPVELAAMSPAQKAVVKLAAIGRRARARKPLVERAGKVISADNEKKLRSAHDHMSQACDIVMGIVGAEEPEAKNAPPAPAPANDDVEKTARREAAARLRAELSA